MEKISNSVVGKCCPAAVDTYYLPFSGVTHDYFTETINTTLATSVQTWKTANPTARIITRTPMIGYDGVTGLLIESTTETVFEPLNSVTLQTYVTAATAALQVTAVQTWKTANPGAKIIATTLLTGNDGETGYLIEYTTSSTYTGPTNAQTSQTYFTTASTTDYAQYLAWKIANGGYKPLRINKLVANDGEVGIFVEYATVGSFPTAAGIQQSFVSDVDSAGGPGAIAAWKAANLTKSILRITPIYEGLLIEYQNSGSTPVNSDVSQSYYANDPANTDGNTAYQVFKTANPTLIPIRLTPIIWGDGTTGNLAEYINP